MSLNAYEAFLTKLFSDDSRFLVGEELSSLLQKKFNITSDNSRKVIQRAVTKGIIKSSAPLTFGKKQYLYMATKTGLSKEVVKRITKEHRPPIYRLLWLLDLNNGIISYYEALKVTASPLAESTTKVSTLGDIVSVLKKINLIEQILYPQECLLWS